MSRVLIQMSMPLDGYVAGPNDSDANPLGDRVLRLHEWMFAGPETPRRGTPQA